MATGNQIRKYRKKLGWTLSVLSQQCDVDVGTLSALEKRDSSKSDFFVPIARAFGLTVEQLADTSTDWPVKDTRASKTLAERPQVLQVKEAQPEFDPWLQAAISELKTIHTSRRAETLEYLTWQAKKAPPGDGHDLPVAA